MDLQLNDKIALVTGSSKGVGEAIAVALAREGAHVIVHGRDSVQAERVVNAIVSAGGRAYAVLGDLTQDEAVERLVAEVEDRVGAIDILVNNAGGSGPKNDWQTTTAEGWASTYDRNVLAAVRVSKRTLPGMRQAGWGRVINISSGAATMPPATGPDYAAAKAAINAMTASMAKAVAAEGITVNAISPERSKAPGSKTVFALWRKHAVSRRKSRPGRTFSVECYRFLPTCRSVGSANSASSRMPSHSSRAR